MDIDKLNAEYNLDFTTISNKVTNFLQSYDFGELYIENQADEYISIENGKIRNLVNSARQGFGLRAVLGESVLYSHSHNINEQEILNSINFIDNSKKQINCSINQALSENQQLHNLYSNLNPIKALGQQKKIELLQQIDDYLRSKNKLVIQVSAAIATEYKKVIILAGSAIKQDIRPLTRLTISVIVDKNGRREQASNSIGGRQDVNLYLHKWQEIADKALADALTNLDSIAAPKGSMPVILGSGWPGVLLHEAIGHGLEGDAIRKQSSVFHKLKNKKIASDLVTVVDDGTIEGVRGSINIDDEGSETKRNVLIENGELVQFMQDKQNAMLMNDKLTGNGRRENYMCTPMPRMTNTFMLNGNSSKAEMIADIKRGIYAENFGGGQVDTTSGEFVFSATGAFLIENGKITAPVKGATLVGDGATALKNIVAVGNDLALDNGIGTCGKNGQQVPVGVGQPSVKLSSMIVGGTG